MKLTDYESKVQNYLVQKGSKPTYLLELIQFSTKKDVKAKTILRAISELKKKYTSENLPVPWKTQILNKIPTESKTENIKLISDSAKVLEKSEVVDGQKLVQVKINKKSETAVAPTPTIQVSTETSETSFQKDFKLRPLVRQVVSRDGVVTLDNIDDWNLMSYIHAQGDNKIYLNDLKDLFWHNHGSKTPTRWMDSILRRINCIRRAIPAMNGRLITVPDRNGTYFLCK